ncbi:MAG: DUF4012 domain-containing protein [Patescibacteria group bacterium]
MKHVSRKNISRHISDVRHPHHVVSEVPIEEAVFDEPPIDSTKAPGIFSKPETTKTVLRGYAMDHAPRKNRRLGEMALAITLVLIVGGAVAATFFYHSERKLLNSASVSFEQFQSAVSRLDFLGQTDAGEGARGSSEVRKNTNTGNESLFSDLRTLVGNFVPLIQEGGKTFAAFQSLGGQALLLGQELEAAKKSSKDFLFKQQGGEFIGHLEKAQGALGAILKETSDLSATAGKFKGVLPVAFDEYLPFQVEIKRFHDFLGAFTGWLKSSDAPRHFAVFFENPSEMRPSGGFIGSYADLSIRNGNIENIEVHDISDADRLLDLKVVPPEPLQALVTRWRAADANWFFDFSDSASKVLSFLEASKLYGDTIRFDGAAGISGRVAQDILALSGPIEIPEYRTTLTKDNFLQELQRIIQEKRGAGSSEPKVILKKVTLLLLEKLSRISEDDQDKLFSLFRTWLDKKDLVFYFKDQNFQRFFNYYNWTGSIYSIPKDSMGDYLAVVTSNIGGEKTDLYVKQKVFLQSQIEDDGTVNNHLVVSKEHQGKKSVDAWHRAPHVAYLKIFAPPTAKLTNASGGVEKKIIPRAQYAKEQYAVDEAVARVEATGRAHLNYPAVRLFEEYDRSVFATWMKVPLGEKRDAVFDYTYKLLASPKAGQAYRFVFDKQPGVQSTYMFEINAPYGFRWQENGLPTFEYSSDDPDGRVILDLTLEKIRG